MVKAKMTASERKRAQRERLKAKGEYAIYRINENLKMKQRRKKRKDAMTVDEKHKLLKQQRDNMRKYRLKQKLKDDTQNQNLNESATTNDHSKFANRSTFGKALAKVRRNLPKCPLKSEEIIYKLAEEICPQILKKSPINHAQHKVTNETRERVVNFYKKDCISYQAPGARDFITVRNNGKKEKVQKRYLCMTLSEVFSLFVQEFPNNLISRSFFCELRPAYVQLRSETPQNTCLCIYHENIRLILQSLSFLPNNFTDFLQLVTCHLDSEMCSFTQSCEQCGHLKKFEELVDSIEINILETPINYSTWANDESGKLIRMKLCSTTDEILEILRKKLPQFLKHCYIHRHQSIYFENLKNLLPTKTLLLHIDFSENYTFPYQDEVQSAHWTSHSCTIYTVIAYFIDNSNKITLPIVVISDYLNHDKYAVNVFNEKVIEYIKLQYQSAEISKIIFKSDGTGQHFKQKYSLCLITCRPEDVEWHFTATSYGKGPIDGLGGTIKRCVREATISRKIDPRSAKDFEMCAKKLCPNITTFFISNDEILNKKHEIDNKLFPNGQPINGIYDIRNMHCFAKMDPYKIKASVTSTSSSHKEFEFKNARAVNENMKRCSRSNNNLNSKRLNSGRSKNYK